MEKLTTKSVDVSLTSKLIEEFNFEECAVRDTSELTVFISVCMKLLDSLTEILAEKGRESGYDEVYSQIASLKKIIKVSTEVLASRTFEEEETLVKLTKENSSTTVDENNNLITETEEVVDELYQRDNFTTYSVYSVAEYNELTNSNKTEEEHLKFVLDSLHTAHFDNVIHYAKKPLSEFDDSVIEEIIPSNLRWHTLLNVFSIDKRKLLSALNSCGAETKQSLIDNYVIKKGNGVKISKTRYEQLSLLGDEYESIDVLSGE